MQKILIIQTAYIGDVILATSLIRKVRELEPGVQIDFLLRAGNESLLQNSKEITNLYIWDKKRKYRSLFKNLKEIRKQNYDVTINIQRFFNSGLFTILSKAKATVGFDKNPLSLFFTHNIAHKIPYKTEAGDILHEVQRNALLLKPLFKNYVLEPIEKLPLKLDFSKKDETYISNLTKDLEKYIVIAPASVWYTKQFPKEKWTRFVEQIPRDTKIFFIGAPSDYEFIADIVPSQGNTINMAGKLTLLQSALLMRNAQRVFVNDSAPLHLASAVQANTTAIFCSTVSDFGYYPISKNSIIIEETLNLECRPCGLHGKKECPLGHFECAHSIPVSSLIDSIDSAES